MIFDFSAERKIWKKEMAVLILEKNGGVSKFTTDYTD